MAVNFNGTTSKVENTAADLDITGPYTFVAWTYADGIGEGGFGRVIELPENADTLLVQHLNVADTLTLVAGFSTTAGRWNIPVPDLQFNAVAISHDPSSVLNDPVARVDFAPVAVTETATPVGTFTAPAVGYCIGNRTAQDRSWDGMLSHVQIFNVALTDAEMDQAARRPGSVRRGLKLWLPLYHAAYPTDISGNQFPGVGTDLTNRVGGPPVAPLYSSSYIISTGDVKNITTVRAEFDFEISSTALFTTSFNAQPFSAEFDFSIGSANFPVAGDLGTFGAEFSHETRSVALSFFTQGRGVNPGRVSLVGSELRSQTVFQEPRRMNPIGVD